MDLASLIKSDHSLDAAYYDVASRLTLSNRQSYFFCKFLKPYVGLLCFNLKILN